MNRERFHEVQERIEQVINVLGEHDVTATILETLSKKNHDAEMKMHVSIGAGVTLTCQHPGGGEGTTIVDLGSGIFGERSWSDAASLTRERMEELGVLLENLNPKVSNLNQPSHPWLNRSRRQLKHSLNQKQTNLLRKKILNLSRLSRQPRNQNDAVVECLGMN